MTCKKGILNVSKTEKRIYYRLQNHKPLFLTVYIFNMSTLAQVKSQKNKQRRKKKYVLRHGRIINLTDCYANGSLILDEYFIEISKTIEKRKPSPDININSTENLP